VSRVSSLTISASKVEDEMARMTANNEDIKNLLSIPGINIYSAVAILSEIGDIKRFGNKEHLASYAGLVPRQFQSGNRDIKGAHNETGSIHAQVYPCACSPFTDKILKKDDEEIPGHCSSTW
jgi:transposase